MPQITQLDLAWEAINALGGKPDNTNPADIAYDAAIEAALAEIEKLGGEDPAPKRYVDRSVVSIGNHDPDFLGKVEAIRQIMGAQQ